MAVFALDDAGTGSLGGSLLMIGAILSAGLGYAEGAVLSRRMGAWQVIFSALVLPLPITLLAVLNILPLSPAAVQMPA